MGAHVMQDIPLNQDHLHLGNQLVKILAACSLSGTYNVNEVIIDSQKLKAKQIMLNVMGVNDLRQVNSQQDAAKCIQTFLCATSQTNFLWHFTEEKLQCDGCATTATSITPNSVAAIDVSHFLHNGYIIASDAIQRHY